MDDLIVACTSCGRKNRISPFRQHMAPKCGHCKSPIQMANQAVPIELEDKNFHDFIKRSRLPVMVDFFSPTCGPCQMMTPIVNAMAREDLGRFIIAKLDTGINQQISSFFNIRGVPSFMFFRDGSLVDQITGAVAKNVLEQKLKSLA